MRQISSLLLVLFIVSISGCGITKQLGTMCAELHQANHQLAIANSKLDALTEANVKLDELNQQVSDLHQRSVLMDEKLATMESLAKRFGAGR